MAGSLACTLAGLLVILLATGVIDNPEPPSGAERCVVGCLGLAFFIPGAAVFTAGLYKVVNSVIPGGRSFPVRLAMFLLRRMSWMTISSAIPYLLLVADHVLVLKMGVDVPWTDKEWLESLWKVEALAVHATGFLGAVVAFKATGAGKFCQVACFGLLLFMYYFLAAKYFSEGATFTFMIQILSKFLGFWLAPYSGRKLAELGLRWGAHFMILMVVSMVTEPKLGGEGSFLFGFWYFSILAVLEAFGMLNLSGPESPQVSTPPPGPGLQRDSL